MMIDPRQAEIDRLVRQSHEFAREAEIAMVKAGRARNAWDRSTHLIHAKQFRAISENKAECAAEMVRRYGKQLPLPLPSVPKRGGILLKGQ